MNEVKSSRLQNQTHSSIADPQKVKLSPLDHSGLKQQETLSKNTSGQNLDAQGQVPFENMALVESSQSFFAAGNQQSQNMKVSIVNAEGTVSHTDTNFNIKKPKKKAQDGSPDSQNDDLVQVEESNRGSIKDSSQLYADSHMRIEVPKVTNININFTDAESPTIGGTRFKPGIESTKYSKTSKKDVFGRNSQMLAQTREDVAEPLGGPYQFEQNLRKFQVGGTSRKAQFNRFAMPQINSPGKHQDSQRQIKNCFRGSKVFHKSSLTKRMTVAHSMNFRQQQAILEGEEESSASAWGPVENRNVSMFSPIREQQAKEGSHVARHSHLAQTSMPFKHQNVNVSDKFRRSHESNQSTSFIGERQTNRTKASSKIFGEANNQMASDLDLGISPSGNFQNSLVDGEYFNTHISKPDLQGSLGNIRASQIQSHLTGTLPLAIGAQAARANRNAQRHPTQQSLGDVSKLQSVRDKQNSQIQMQMIQKNLQSSRARNLSQIESNQAMIKIRHQEQMGSSFDNDIRLPSIVLKPGMVINENSESMTPDESMEAATRHGQHKQLPKGSHPGLSSGQSLQQNGRNNFSFGLLGKTVEALESKVTTKQVTGTTNSEEASVGSSLGIHAMETVQTMQSSQFSKHHVTGPQGLAKDQSIVQYPSGMIVNTQEANHEHSSQHLNLDQWNVNASALQLDSYINTTDSPNQEVRVLNPASLTNHYSTAKIFPGGIQSYIPKALKDRYEVPSARGEYLAQRMKMNSTTDFQNNERGGKIDIRLHAPPVKDDYQITSMNQIIAYKDYLKKKNEVNDITQKIGLKPINKFAEFGLTQAAGNFKRNNRETQSSTNNIFGTLVSNSVDDGNHINLQPNNLDLRSMDSFSEDSTKQHRTGSRSPGQRIDKLNRDRQEYMRRIASGVDESLAEPTFMDDPATFSMLHKQVFQPSASFYKAQQKRQRDDDLKNQRLIQKKKSQKKAEQSKSTMAQKQQAQSPEGRSHGTLQQEYFSTATKSVGVKDMNIQQRANLIDQMVMKQESRKQKNQEANVSKVQQDIAMYKQKFLQLQNKGSPAPAVHRQTRKEFMEEQRYRMQNLVPKEFTDADIQMELDILNKSRGLLDKKMMMDLMIRKRHEAGIARLHRNKGQSPEVMDVRLDNKIAGSLTFMEDFDDLKIEQDAQRLIDTHLGLSQGDKDMIERVMREMIEKKKARYRKMTFGHTTHDECPKSPSPRSDGSSDNQRIGGQSPKRLEVPGPQEKQSKYARSSQLQVISEYDENQVNKEAMNQSQQNFLIQKNLVNKQETKFGQQRMSEQINADIGLRITKTTAFQTKKGSQNTINTNESMRNKFNQTQTMQKQSHFLSSPDKEGKFTPGRSHGGAVIKKEITFEDGSEEQILAQDSRSLVSVTLTPQRPGAKGLHFTEQDEDSDESFVSETFSHTEEGNQSPNLQQLLRPKITASGIGPAPDEAAPAGIFRSPTLLPPAVLARISKDELTADLLLRSPLHKQLKYRLDELNSEINTFEMDDHLRFHNERKEAKKGLYKLATKAVVKQRGTHQFLQLQDMNLDASSSKLSFEQKAKVKERIKNYKMFARIVDQFPDLVDDLKECYKIRDFSTKKVAKALERAKEAKEQSQSTSPQARSQAAGSPLSVQKFKTTHNHMGSILKRPSSMLGGEPASPAAQAGGFVRQQTVQIKDGTMPDLKWAHLDLMGAADRGAIKEQYRQIVGTIQEKYHLSMSKSKYQTHTEEDKEEDLAPFVKDPKFKAMLLAGELDPEKKKEVLKEAKVDKEKHVAKQKQDKKEKDMEKKQKQGGMSANDIINLMNDDQMIKRYTQHLLDILFKHHDPFVTAAYLRWKGKTDKPNFYERMAKEIKERQDKEGAAAHDCSHDTVSGQAATPRVEKKKSGMSQAKSLTPKKRAAKAAEVGEGGAKQKLAAKTKLNTLAEEDGEYELNYED